MASLTRVKTVRHIDPGTNKRVPAGTPGAVKTVTKSRKWYVKFVDDCGRVRRVPLSASKPIAQKMMADVVAQVERAKAGIPDPTRPHRNRKVSDHLADWKAVLQARGCVPDYVRSQSQMATKVLGLARVEHADQARRSAVELAIRKLRDSGLSAQTANHHLSATKQFYKWLLGDGRIEANPLAALAAANVRVDRRHDRRALTGAELSALFAAARTAPSRGALPRHRPRNLVPARRLYGVEGVGIGVTRARVIQPDWRATRSVGARRLRQEPPRGFGAIAPEATAGVVGMARHETEVGAGVQLQVGGTEARLGNAACRPGGRPPRVAGDDPGCRSRRGRRDRPLDV